MVAHLTVILRFNSLFPELFTLPVSMHLLTQNTFPHPFPYKCKEAFILLHKNTNLPMQKCVTEITAHNHAPMILAPPVCFITSIMMVLYFILDNVPLLPKK